MSNPRPDPPRLEWDGPDEDGDTLVRIVGCENWHIAAHGTNYIEALARLGEAMHMAYGCCPPVKVADLLSDLRTLEAQWREQAEYVLTDRAVTFREAADDLAALLARLEGT